MAHTCGFYYLWVSVTEGGCEWIPHKYQGLVWTTG